MPEGPEVKYIVKQISDKFKNATLTDISICGGRYARHGAPEKMKKFVSMLPRKIKSFNTKGKFVWIDLGDNLTIWITFGMTGTLITEKTKYCAITFDTNKGPFYMDDVRNFGTISFHFDEKELSKKLDKLGPDPLNENITPSQFITAVHALKQDKQIGRVLLDNKIVSGIGNYLRAEILYAAKVSPYRLLKSLSDDELKSILNKTKLITTTVYEKLLNGKTYEFKVYRRKETPRGEKVEGEKWYGRTIWWVPSIEK